MRQRLRRGRGLFLALFLSSLLISSRAPSQTVVCGTPPVALDDVATATAGEAVLIDFLANDSDADGSPLAVGNLGGTCPGSVTARGDGTVLFVPQLTFSGPCTIEYDLSDGDSTVQATVQVEVAAAVLPDPPPFIDLQPLPAQVPEGGSTSFSVIASAPYTLCYQWQRDGVDLPPATATQISGGTSPTLELINVGFNLEALYRCVVSKCDDPALLATSDEVALDVLANRAPYGGTPWPVPGVLEAEHYDEGEPGTVFHDSTPGNQGNWSVRGDDVDLSTGGSGIIARWNFVTDGEWLEYSLDVNASGPFDVVFHYQLTGSAAVTLRLDLAADSGTIVSETLTLEPTEGFQQAGVTGLFGAVTPGSAVLRMTAVDASSGFQVNWLRFDGDVPELPDLPLASDDPDGGGAYSTLRNVAKTLTHDELLSNDLGFGEVTSATGRRVEVSHVDPPAFGQLIEDAGQVTYLPAADFTGSDSFTYWVRDSFDQNCLAPATVSVEVVEASQVPVAVDDFRQTLPDTELRIYKAILASNDMAFNGQARFHSVVSFPGAGQGTLVDPGASSTYLRYTPPPGATSGQYTFTYDIRDSGQFAHNPPSAPATVTVEVTSDVSRPVANEDHFVLSETRPATRTRLTVSLPQMTGNDQGSGTFNVSFPPGPWNGEHPFGGPDPAHGDFTSHNQGFNFEPAVGFSGETEFKYVLDDLVLGAPSEETTVTLEVVPFPVAVDDGTFTVPHGGTLEIDVGSLLGNDVDHGRVLEILSLGAATHGSVAVVGDALVYTASVGHSGSDSFTYRAVDDLHFFGDTQQIFLHGKADRTSNAATVNLTVLPPGAQAADDEYFVSADQPEFQISTADLLANDSPPGAVSLVNVEPPARGQVIWDPAAPQTLTYLPGSAFWTAGGDQLRYNIARADGNPGTWSTARLQLTARPGCELLFGDGFEGGDLSAWDSHAAIGGSLAASSKATLGGALGLAVTIDPSTTGGGYVFLRDDQPAAETHFWLDVSLHLDPSSFQMAENAIHVLANLSEGTSPTATVKLRGGSGGIELRAVAVRDSDVGGTVSTPWTAVGPAARRVTLEWRAATAPGSSDGFLRLWLDGRRIGEITGIDNDARVVDRLRIGALGGIAPGTDGVFFLDEITTCRGLAGRRYLLEDDFESGTLAAWSATTGSVAAAAGAALEGSFGLEMTASAVGSPAFVTDAAAGGSSRYGADFLLDLQALKMADSDIYKLFSLTHEKTGEILFVKHRYQGGKHQIRLVVTQGDGSTATTPWTDVAAGTRRLFVQWQASSSATAPDGGAWLAIDGASVGSATGLVTGGQNADRFELGIVSGLDAGTSGALRIDQFRSWK